MKKVVRSVILVLALLSIGILGGCSTSKSSSGSNPDTKELSISVWGYDANPEFKGLVEAFKKENKDVKVKIIDIDASKYEDKVTTMLASGDTTDVLAIKGVGSYVNYAEKKQLVDLSSDAKAITGAENFKGNLDGVKLDGKYYALPFRKDIYMLFYNKDLFDAQGIAYPKNLTWDEYEELAKKLTVKKDGQTVYGTYHHTWYPILLCTAASETNNTLLDKDYSFMKDYLDRWRRMQDEGVAMDYGSIKTSSMTYSSQFEGSKTAMMPMGSFYIGKLLNATKAGTTKINWGMTSLPQNEKGKVSTYGGPASFAVNKHSKNQKLARKFVKFCAGEEGAKVVAKIGMTPAYQSDAVMNILYNLDGMPQDEESKKALKPDKNGWEMLPDQRAADINQILIEEYDLIMVKDNTVSKGVKEMEKRISQIDVAD